MNQAPHLSADTEHVLSRVIRAVLAIAPDEGAIEYDGRWISWRELATAATAISDICHRYSTEPTPRVGILLRNTPAHVAALLGVLLAGGCVVVINPARGDDRTRTDIAELELPIVVGTRDDIDSYVGPASPSTVITFDDIATGPEVAAAAGQGSDRRDDKTGVAIYMLTSGSTGPPKRVGLGYDMLARSVLGPDPEHATVPVALSSGVAIVNAPLVHIGGVFRVLQCIVAARPFVLLPRFELNAWADAVRRYRPKAVSLVPAAVRMVLHSDLTREDLAGIRAVTSGTAPLSAEDSEAFTAKFGIPVLTSYAATEFAGGVAAWTLDDYRKYWNTKRGSVGRANPGARLRVVDESGAVLPPGSDGLLEVKPPQLGPDADWVRTTDLARIDADGFLWILGRADQAIIRGGFKIIPDTVRSALESHPSVAAAAVVARTDQRLGAVPVAMVEPRPGAQVGANELMAHVSGRLARYEIPAEIAIVDVLPRTPSGKPELAAVRRHFDSSAAAP
ncbi:long-chain fatty acid--CoA ligase [Nocardia cyriacigeorgica]|uniref:Long-chain fatty acid--CoA ligase n=1 Tax=Nocardia cyriacigeorgica TaxID=135487 RepID=A0A5R8P704_9NOCA|nr:AMP-binding protein [Nocardia cyriacigeorgica]TLF98255.1 long-chain fatty acid--CoA ligase [Nocardia cyriacigeorgica]